MNTLMWDHPFTPKHLSVLKELGIVVIDPIAKKLACGDIGIIPI
jgi:phosphopantothenoylcysteine decarboxylase